MVGAPSPGSPVLGRLPAFLDPRGRSGRAAFWIGVFVHFQLLQILGIDRWIAEVRHGLPPQFGGGLATVVTFLEFWLIFVLITRRWHDTGFRVPWWLILGIPLFGWLVVPVILAFVGGTNGPNRWGPPPGADDGELASLRRTLARARSRNGEATTRPSAAPSASAPPRGPAARAARRPAKAATVVAPASGVITRATPKTFAPKRDPVIVRPRRLF